MRLLVHLPVFDVLYRSDHMHVVDSPAYTLRYRNFFHVDSVRLFL